MPILLHLNINIEIIYPTNGDIVENYHVSYHSYYFLIKYFYAYVLLTNSLIFVVLMDEFHHLANFGGEIRDAFEFVWVAFHLGWAGE